MNLAQRLYNLARARLPRKSEPLDLDLSDFEVPCQAGSTSRGAHSEGGSGSQGFEPGPVPSGQDPELARYYANLELPYGSDLEAVRSAWKRLLRRYHPDLHAGDPGKRELAERLTTGLNQAYAALEERLKQNRR